MTGPGGKQQGACIKLGTNACRTGKSGERVRPPTKTGLKYKSLKRCMHGLTKVQLDANREAVHSQKVTKLWTLSVPPLDPLPASTDTQRGVFGKAQKDD